MEASPVVPRAGEVEDDVFVFPLSFAQERVWFMDQLAPGTPTFNLTTVSRLDFPFDESVLRASLTEIVRRHESLRTTFHAIGGKPVQVVHASAEVGFGVVDLRSLPASDRARRAEELADAEARRPFDLARGPLVRVRLVRMKDLAYQLILTMHHIVSDAWSMGVFWQELSAIWGAYARGGPSPLLDPPIQYADFAVWQREQLTGALLEREVEHWRRRLDGAHAVELATDRPRPATQSFRGGVVMVTVPSRLARAVEAVGRHADATPFMTLLAAFLVLLDRYSGQHDVVVGSYIAGRNRKELEGLIGFFLNTLVLRVDLSGDPTFEEVLDRVRHRTLEAYEHQDVPFAKLVEALRPDRDLSRNPLFQILFQMLNIPALADRAASDQRHPLKPERRHSPFDLSCMVGAAAGGGTEIEFEYATDLFDHGTIERMAGHYLTLLASIVRRSSARISELELMGAEELRRVVVEWNRTDVPRPGQAGLLDLLRAQVAAHPEAPALIADEASLSYRALDERSDRLAALLVSAGVRPGQVVGVCVRRSLDPAVALIGTWKAGAVYLALDPTYPVERLAFMLDDAGAAALLADDACPAGVESRAPVVIRLDGAATETAGRDAPTLRLGRGRPATPADPAYVLYTSGSTGGPKGVTVPHRQILNRLAWMWERYPFAPGEVACQKTALNFVDSFWELLGGLLQGTPTVVIPDATLRDPFALVDRLGRDRVSRLWLVPSLLRTLLDAVPDLGKRLPHLRFWVSSGEPLTSDLLRRFRTAAPGATLYNLYGTTEIWDATWYEPTDHDPPSWGVPIGRPISNVQTYVLDEAANPVPVGVVGELWVGGMGLADGYVDRPELDEQRFRSHRLPGAPERRLYRTGDLVRWLPDGNIEFVGRRDHQVKVRGYRIELGEVEAALGGHPAVRDAVTMIRDGADRSIVGYVVLEPGATISAADLKSSLRATLPEHMIPSAILRLPSLPLTPNGKLDRAALPDVGRAVTGAARSTTGPRTPTERAIAAIWSDVLGVEAPGVEENFFDLGGHSLLLFQVFTRIRDDLSWDISMTDLFRHPTVADLARHVGGDDGGERLDRVRPRAARQRAHLVRARPTVRSGDRG